MRIRLDRYYSSARAPHIPAGEYDADDARLCGQAAYLVANEIAVVIEADAPQAAPTDTEAPAPKKGKRK